MFKLVWKAVEDKADKARMVEAKGERTKERKITRREEQERIQKNNN